jgi:hypothetical protein
MLLKKMSLVKMREKYKNEEQHSQFFLQKKTENVIKLYNTLKFAQNQQIWMYYVLENLSRNELKRLF